MSVDDAHLDALLRALADATRRALLDRLRDAPGCTLSTLIAGFPQSRQALSKHVALLEDVDLVVPLWRGREKLHYLNPVPLQALPARWVTASAREDARAMSALEQALATTNQRAAAAPKDAIGAFLLQAPGHGLDGRPVLSASALDAARGYLADTGRAVTMLLDAMTREQGYAKPRGGGFSLAEHLWHLADLETFAWRPRFARMLAQLRPRLPGVDGDRLAVERRYQSRPWRGAARRFVAERRRTLATLRRYDEAVLKRPVTFAGSRTHAGGVVAAAVAHDREHRAAMAQRWLEMARAETTRRSRR